MKNKIKVKKSMSLEIIEDTNPNNFIKKFTTFYEENKLNIVEQVKTFSDGKYVAIITLQKTEVIQEKTIADDFHEQGITYLCRQCEHLENDHDGRKKWFPCKYAEYGRTRIDCEVCDLFYKWILQGKIEPKE